MASITPDKTVRLGQLSDEMGGVGLCRNDETGEIVPASGETVTQAELEDAVAAHVADPGPDTGGFLDAVMGALGKPTGRTLLRDYPDVQIALDRARWDLLHAAIDDMHTAGDLSTADRDTVLALASDHHIPDPATA